MGEADTQLKWNWKKNKEQAQKRTPENYVVRLLAYVHGRKQKKNNLLVKRSYKYCGILACYPKPQYTQTLTTLITQEFIKLLISHTTLSLLQNREEKLKKMEWIKWGGSLSIYIQNWLLNYYYFFLGGILFFHLLLSSFSSFQICYCQILLQTKLLLTI